MGATFTESTKQAAGFSIGPMKAQLMDYAITSGTTSGTITATNLSKVQHVVFGASDVQHSTAPTFSNNAVTLAIVVPAETAASLIVQDLTYTAVADLGASGNNITIAYTAGATAGAEVVTVVGNAISVQIESTVSTATQIRTAVLASTAAAALVGVTVSGTGSNAQTTAAATALAGGVTGGARGTVLLLGK